MKDLITTIGSVMILMVFVLQFCSNFVISTRVLVADKILDECKIEQVNSEDGIDNQVEAGPANWEIYQNKLAQCFDCPTNEILLEKKNRQYIVKVPLKDIIVCADFLGISEEENRSTYVGVINEK